MNDFENLATIYDTIKEMPVKDIEAEARAIAHQNQLTKPPGALGILEELAVFLASWQRKTKPSLNSVQAIVFAGNHGICSQGVNPFPQDVTSQMVENFKTGGAAINQLCEVSGANLNIVPLSLEKPTADFTKEEAMSELELCEAMAIGAKSVNLDSNLVLLGEMGIGNSTISSALAATVFGGRVERWVGAGTGSDQKGQAHKAAVIELSLIHI